MNNSLRSKISHDGENNRIYLMYLDPFDFPRILEALDQLSIEKGYTKIIAKVPPLYMPSFLAEGYNCEACIPSFFNGDMDVFFLVKYFSAERQKIEKEELQALQKMLFQLPSSSDYSVSHYTVRVLSETDIDAMIAIFLQVFPSYPFPIFSSDFLCSEMQSGRTTYFGAFDNDVLIGISSAECDGPSLSVEMTDFAVVSEHRGKKIASLLLQAMETQLGDAGYKSFYTICRLRSLAMNKTFFNAGYAYAGTLKNNTQISGSIESMNVWYKGYTKYT